jgi:hypothetical protein
VGILQKTALRKLNFESVNSLNKFGVVQNKPLALSASVRKLPQVIIVLFNQLRNTKHHCFSENNFDNPW